MGTGSAINMKSFVYICLYLSTPCNTHQTPDNRQQTTDDPSERTQTVDEETFNAVEAILWNQNERIGVVQLLLWRAKVKASG